MSLTKVNWWDLNENCKLKLLELPSDLKSLGDFISVRRLLKSSFRHEISDVIFGIKTEMTGPNFLPIKFPLDLNTSAYAKLYSLIYSEGSSKTELALHVPEEFFHKMFTDCLSDILNQDMSLYIRVSVHAGFLRSRAPAILRNIIPFPNKIPEFICNNKSLSKEYLRVAFEAEGSAIFKESAGKRYIKISRYIDITSLVKSKSFPVGKRIYSNSLREGSLEYYNILKSHPPIVLAQEKDLLEKHFGIKSTLVFEAIRHNYTSSGFGKITARWVLFIYASNVLKFVEKIGFISDKKKDTCNKFLVKPFQKPQYSNLDTIRSIIDENGFFYSKDFVTILKKEGYVSPRAFLSRFLKKGLIKRISKGFYQLN